MEPLLEARGITKAFAGVVAVDSLDLTILPGEVLALVGENGAGKSTVIKMISGQYAPDAGDLRCQGRPVAFRAPVDARNAGIGVIHQELLKGEEGETSGRDNLRTLATVLAVRTSIERGEAVTIDEVLSSDR